MTFHAPVTKPYGVAPSPYMAQGAAKGLWKGLAFIAPFQTKKGAGTSTLLDRFGHPHAGSNMVAGSTLEWRGTPYGLGVGISGASDLLDQDNFAPVTASNGDYTGDFTYVCLANPKAEARVSALLAQSESALTNRSFLLANSGDVSGDFSVSVTGTVANAVGGIDGKYHLFAGRRRGSDLHAFIDGEFRAGAVTTAAIGSAACGLAFGSRGEDVTLRIDTACNIVLVAAWNRALSNAEMRLLGIDPFIMFRPAAEQKIINTVAAGGTAVPVFMHHYMQQRAA